MKRTLIVLGTLDTKGPETNYLVSKIKLYDKNSEIDTMVIDTGILGQPDGILPDITREEVANAAGYTIDEVRNSGSRGEAISRMVKGITVILTSLYQNDNCHGIVSLAGASGGSITSAAMEAVPIGVPKLMATPLASGPRPFSFFIGTKDVMIMHSVIDIMGVNSVSSHIYDTLAGAAVGAVLAYSEKSKSSNAVGITMLGNTTKGAMHLKKCLEKQNLEVVAFHSSGIGGRAMEQMAKEGFFKGIIDYTTNEVFEDIIGGLQRGAGPDRLTIAGKAGIPQLIVPGSIDFFDQGPIDTIPEQYINRKLYKHSPTFTLVRLTKQELYELGHIFAEKLNPSIGPTTVVIPLKGFSIPDCPGGPFEDVEADMAFVKGLKEKLRIDIKIHEIDAHVNDEIFAENVANIFEHLVKNKC
jgi:uncharacterized protein (UPF0261 family)